MRRRDVSTGTLMRLLSLRPRSSVLPIFAGPTIEGKDMRAFLKKRAKKVKYLKIWAKMNRI